MPHLSKQKKQELEDLMKNKFLSDFNRMLTTDDPKSHYNYDRYILSLSISQLERNLEGLNKIREGLMSLDPMTKESAGISKTTPELFIKRIELMTKKLTEAKKKRITDWSTRKVYLLAIHFLFSENNINKSTTLDYFYDKLIPWYTKEDFATLHEITQKSIRDRIRKLYQSALEHQDDDYIRNLMIGVPRAASKKYKKHET